MVRANFINAAKRRHPHIRICARLRKGFHDHDTLGEGGLLLARPRDNPQIQWENRKESA